MSDLLTPAEAAEVLGVKLHTIKTLRRTGRLRYLRVGAEVRITRQALENFIRRAEKEAAASHPCPIPGPSEAPRRTPRNTATQPSDLRKRWKEQVRG